MKWPIKEMMYLGVSTMVFVFILGLLFQFDFSGSSGMFTASGTVYEAYEEEQIFSENGERINELVNSSGPQIRYISRVYTAGEKFLVKELFEVKASDTADFVPASETEDVSVTVQDIKDKEGKSIMADAEMDDETAEELATVIFEPGTGTICFFQSGIYTLRVLVWGENGRTVLGEITLPVETG